MLEIACGLMVPPIERSAFHKCLECALNEVTAVREKAKVGFIGWKMETYQSSTVVKELTV